MMFIITMLIPDLLNILFDQCDYDTLIKLCLLHKRKTAYAKKYSVLIGYDVFGKHTAETEVVCAEGKMKIIKLISGVFFDCQYDQFLDVCVKHAAYKRNAMGPIRMIDALELCAKNGRLELVKYFVIQINRADINPNPALNEAAGYGFLQIIKYLLNVPTTVCIDYNKPLIICAEYGHLDCVTCLVDIGACVDAEYGTGYYSFERMSALSCAAKSGHMQVVEYLINAGADVHLNDEYALRISIANGQLNIVKYLIDVGCCASNERKQIALLIAARTGHVETMKYLVSIGANIDACRSALLLNAYVHDQKEVMDYLNKN